MNIKTCPCGDCPERFPACSGKCPKDARGDYGYKAWKTEQDAEKAALQKLYYHPETYAYKRSRWKSYNNDYSGAYKKFSG